MSLLRSPLATSSRLGQLGLGQRGGALSFGDPQIRNTGELASLRRAFSASAGVGKQQLVVSSDTGVLVGIRKLIRRCHPSRF